MPPIVELTKIDVAGAVFCDVTPILHGQGSSQQEPPPWLFVGLHGFESLHEFPWKAIYWSSTLFEPSGG